MIRTMTMVTVYVCRRRRRDLVPADDDPGEYGYEVWLVAENHPLPDTGVPELSAGPVLSAGAAAELGEGLRAAAAEVTADRAVTRVWRSGDLPGTQAADFVISLPGTARSLVGMPVAAAAAGAGIPAPAASFGTDVIITALLKPVLGPLEATVHAFEVAGIILGFLIPGVHPLLVTCVRALARDQLSSALASAFGDVLNKARAQRLEQPSTASPAAATPSPNPATTHDMTARHGPDPHGKISRRRLPTVSGADPASARSGVVGAEVSNNEKHAASPATQELFELGAGIAAPVSPSDLSHRDSETSSLAHGAAETDEQLSGPGHAARLDRGITDL